MSAGGCERSDFRSEVRGSGLECQAVTAQELPRGATPRPSQGQLGGATPRPRSGAAAGRRYPASEVWAVAERSNPTSEVRGGWEETPCV